MNESPRPAYILPSSTTSPSSVFSYPAQLPFGANSLSQTPGQLKARCSLLRARSGLPVSHTPNPKPSKGPPTQIPPRRAPHFTCFAHVFKAILQVQPAWAKFGACEINESIFTSRDLLQDCLPNGFPLIHNHRTKGDHHFGSPLTPLYLQSIICAAKISLLQHLPIFSSTINRYIFNSRHFLIS